SLPINITITCILLLDIIRQEPCTVNGNGDSAAICEYIVFSTRILTCDALI
ncbi:unnamed protein product, partial [Rotaria sp. Silwood2]